MNWNCNKCTYINETAAAVCDMCATFQPKQSFRKKRKCDEVQNANTESAKAAPSQHLPIIMCIGMVEYTDEEYFLKMETMKHPETLVRFRDTMRLRALRKLCDGKYEVISVCCLPHNSPESTRVSKFRSSCFDLKYQNGMSLANIREAGYLGQIGMVIFDYGSRMLSGYFRASFSNLTCVFDLSRRDLADDLGIYVAKNADTVSMIERLVSTSPVI